MPMGNGEPKNMLCLTRKIGEVIDIDQGKIRVQVLGCRGDRIRLGIIAPKETKILRGELKPHRMQGDHQ